MIVGCLPENTKFGVIFCSLIIFSSFSAASSSPTIPISSQGTPNDERFNATLAAPPGRSSLFVTLTTGTGASGEMRLD